MLKKMDKQLTLWIVIALLALAVIYVMLFSGETTAVSDVASTGQQAVQSSSGMVGGC